MSDKLPTQNASDEVDLIALFNLVGSAFSRFFNFIFSILRGLFSGIIYLIKPLINNFKIIAIVMVLAGVAGVVVEQTKRKVYTSQMMVKPYFDSKYQLITNINYYNALIDNENYDALSKIFNLEGEVVEQIKSFDIYPGPETENDRIIQYDNFVKSIDSVRAQEVSFDDFVDNRSIYSGDFFEISVESYKIDIFPDLEKGLNSSFTNKYSLKKMEKRDSLISIQKENLIASIAEVDSLQKVYIKVLEEEAKSDNASLTLGESFALSPEKSNTKEFELLNKEINLRDQLRKLDEQKVEEDVFFDTVSSFQEVGNLTDEITEKYSLIFPILAFIIMCLAFIRKKVVVFVKQYEQ